MSTSIFEVMLMIFDVDVNSKLKFYLFYLRMHCSNGSNFSSFSNSKFIQNQSEIDIVSQQLRHLISHQSRIELTPSSHITTTDVNERFCSRVKMSPATFSNRCQRNRRKQKSQFSVIIADHRPYMRTRFNGKNFFKAQIG